MRFKEVFPYILLITILLSCKEEPKSVKSSGTKTNTVEFDSILAQKLGADEYGMHQYVMAFLKLGPKRDQDSIAAAKLQRAHLDNINRMAKNGDLIIAGPFMDDAEIRGIYIFNCSSVEKARELTQSDPAIQSGRLIMELHPWYGPAGLISLDTLQKRITKTQI